MKSVAMPPIDDETKKKGSSVHRIGCCFVFLLGGFMVFAYLAPGFMRARAQGQLTACKSNLRNISDACEMYSTDYEGRYPKEISLLTPNYLKTIPLCPVSNADTYSLHFKSGTRPSTETQKDEPYYSMRCAGENHTWVGLKPDFPAWDSTQGLSEGPK